MDNSTRKIFKKCLEGFYDPKKDPKALKCTAPKQTNIEVERWLAYPVKNLARGPDDEAKYPDLDADKSGRFRSIGLFEGISPERLPAAKDKFCRAIMRAYIADQDKDRVTYIRDHRDFWEKDLPTFQKRHCPGIELVKANRPELIGRMFTFRIGHFRPYEFSSCFLPKKACAYLNGLDPNEDDLHAQVKATVAAKLEKDRRSALGLAAGASPGTIRKLVACQMDLKLAKADLRELNLELNKAKEDAKYTAVYNRKKNARRTSIITALEAEKRELQTELQEAKSTIHKLQQPPKKKRRMGRVVTHACDKCEGRSDETRIGCARDQNLPWS